MPYAFFNVDENAVAASRETESIYLELGKPTCSSMALSFHEQRGVYYRSDGTAPYDILADAMSKAQTQDGERAYLKTETDEQFCAISDVLDELLTCWLDENYGNSHVSDAGLSACDWRFSGLPEKRRTKRAIRFADCAGTGVFPGADSAHS